MNVKEIKKICKKNDFVPLRRRGQNFLINPKVIGRIVDVAEINGDDVILEIGPGLGALTKPIADKCKKVIAVEIDKKLVEILKERLSNYINIEIIKGSILDGTSNLNLRKKKYKVVANLPFNITGRVLRILLEQRNKPELIVVVVQKEVAQRIVAQPPHMSLLSLAIQFYSQVNAVFSINKSNFWPQPRVDSTILKIRPNKSKIKQEIEDKFFQLIKAGFSSKRKYLLNNLVKSVIIIDDCDAKKQKQKFLEIFQETGLNEKVRAQELSLEQWIEIASKIN